MRKLRALPIDFLSGSGVVHPADPQLFKAAQVFCQEQLGNEVNLGKMTKCWIVFEENEDGSLLRVVAIGGIVWRLDIPLFHVAKPSNGAGREGMVSSLRASELLYERIKSYVEDNGGRGYEVFIGVQDDAEGTWARFLEKIGAKKAQRYVVTA